ncbi:site-2 protease family protein [Anaerobacillus alkaliphilus]|uniref:site-2 protease family protein n=1 Tax=Anaerobacillus alkaliphilus TaxID=1548597 RepID=UPI00137649AB|nr:site-2 protease family protein [Anaerobacillus alkaliphilus]
MASLIFIIFCTLTILPVTIVLHELGHLFFARLCQAKEISITLGIGNELFRFKSFNTTFIFCFLPIGGQTKYELLETKSWQRRIISIGGPLMNGWVAFLLLIPGIGYGTQYITIWFQWLAMFNIWMLLINTIPFKFGNYYSDGWIVFAKKI